jgi:hypothetical protein
LFVFLSLLSFSSIPIPISTWPFVIPARSTPFSHPTATLNQDPNKHPSTILI